MQSPALTAGDVFYSSLSEVWQVLSTSQVVSETVKDLADHLGLMREMKVDDPELDVSDYRANLLVFLTEQRTDSQTADSYSTEVLSPCNMSLPKSRQRDTSKQASGCVNKQLPVCSTGTGW